MRIDELIVDKIKKHKSLFIIGLFLFLVGLICHGYMLYNKLPHFDEAGSVNGFLGIATPHGRWALPFTGILNGPFSSPGFNGSLSLIFIILSAFLISDILKIKSHLAILCIGSIFISFPTVTSIFTFMFMAVAFTFSLFLETLAVWLAVTELPCWLQFQKKNPLVFNAIKLFLSACIMAGGIGIYQAYYQVACAVVLLYGLQLFIKEDHRTVAFNAVKLIFLLFLGMVINLIMAKIGCLYTGKEYSVSYGAGSPLELVKNLPHALSRCYSNFISIFLSDYRGISFNWIVRIALLVLVLIGIVLYEYLLLCKHKNLLLGNLLLILLPLTLGVIGLTMTSRGLDTLTVFSYALLIVFPFAILNVAEETLKLRIQNILWGAVMAGSLIITWQYAILSNNVYTTMDIAKTEAMSYYTAMITQIRSMDDYSDNLSVCLLGTESSDATVYDLSDYYRGDIRGQMTCNRFINMYSRYYFLSIFLGFDSDFIAWQDYLPTITEETLNILNAMPSYPDSGSIKIIDNTVVVKISNDYISESDVNKQEWRN